MNERELKLFLHWLGEEKGFSVYDEMDNYRAFLASYDTSEFSPEIEFVATEEDALARFKTHEHPCYGR